MPEFRVVAMCQPLERTADEWLTLLIDRGIDVEMRPLTQCVSRSVAALEHLAHRTPLGRVGRPEELASLVQFLAVGKPSSFVTRQGWIVDGGVTPQLASE